MCIGASHVYAYGKASYARDSHSKEWQTIFRVGYGGSFINRSCPVSSPLIKFRDVKPGIKVDSFRLASTR